jgi:triacylglycerol lipase
MARLQQLVVVVTLLWSLGWLVLARDASAGVMAAGVLLILGGYALVLALEFVAVAWVNRGDSVPRAGAAALAAAWWQEVRVAPQVFSWRQPFRWRSLPDHAVPAAPGRTAAVLVHGFVCNRGFWLPWMRDMLQRNMPYTSVNLEPVFGSIDEGVPLIDDAVRRAHALTGCPPVLVCHSMGGLAARAWRAATPDADTRVRAIVTIGTPHHGTWLGRFSHVTNGRQMRQQGDWLQALQTREAEAHESRRNPHATYDRFICWYSNADNIVFPASTAMLPGADNRHVPGVAHVALGFHPQVMNDTLNLLATGGESAS